MGVYIGSIDVKPDQQSRRRVLATNRQAYFAPTPGTSRGHLIFLSDNTLMAQPFDPATQELSGASVPIAEHVDSYPVAQYGLFSVSETGTVVYRQGSSGTSLSLTWVDSTGQSKGTFGEPGAYQSPAVSPDGTRVAVSLGQTIASRDIWILDVTRNTTTRFTFNAANNMNAVWSPDGRSIAFSSNRTGQNLIYVKPADGSREERLIMEKPGVPTSWSSDGRFLLFTTTGAKTGSDIWALPDPGRPSGAATPFPVLESPFNEGVAQISPDGRWIAYQANESGTPVIYVQPFIPKNGANTKWLISKDSGILPRWRNDGRQLFYVTSDAYDLTVVDINTDSGFQSGPPRRLFRLPASSVVGLSLMPDGSRFLCLTTPNAGRNDPFTVLINWAAALKK